MARVVLAMSGGVDSSVAADLLLRAGHEVIGVFMRHGEQSIAACALDGKRENSPLLPVLNGRADHKQGCCSSSDAEDARSVAGRLGIPFYALNLQAEFRGIIDYFVDEYARGRTPNPCVMCNNRIKFGKLFDYADSVGAAYVATGHYARLVREEGQLQLLRGVDARNPQPAQIAAAVAAVAVGIPQSVEHAFMRAPIEQVVGAAPAFGFFEQLLVTQMRVVTTLNTSHAYSPANG